MNRDAEYQLYVLLEGTEQRKRDNGLKTPERAYWQGKTDALRIADHVIYPEADYPQAQDIYTIGNIKRSPFAAAIPGLGEKVGSLLHEARIEASDFPEASQAQQTIQRLRRDCEDLKRSTKDRLERMYWQGKADGYRLTETICFGDDYGESQVFSSGAWQVWDVLGREAYELYQSVRQIKAPGGADES